MENTLRLAMRDAVVMLNSMPPEAAAEVIRTYQSKTTIVVYSWHTYGQSGGFNWEPATEDNLKILLDSLDLDAAQQNVANGIVVEFSLLAAPRPWSPLDREDVTDYIDAVLLDVIETGQIGHIHARFTTTDSVN